MNQPTKRDKTFTEKATESAKEFSVGFNKDTFGYGKRDSLAVADLSNDVDIRFNADSDHQQTTQNTSELPEIIENATWNILEGLRDKRLDFEGQQKLVRGNLEEVYKSTQKKKISVNQLDDVEELIRMWFSEHSVKAVDREMLIEQLEWLISQATQAATKRERQRIRELLGDFIKTIG